MVSASSAKISCGTDSPVEDCNPFPNIYSAVTRRDLKGLPAGGFYPQECVDVCTAHDAPPFERFFGHAVLAVALRGAGRPEAAARAKAQALAEYEQVPEAERTWCATELAELGT